MMNSSAGDVALELRELQYLSDNTLRAIGRIAMNQDRQNTRALGVADAILLGTNQTFDDRIDGFEMAWVEGNRNQDLFALAGGVDAAGAKVVLDVAGALHAVRIGLAFEFREHLHHRFADHIRENVKPSAMGHADDSFMHIFVGGLHQGFRRERRWCVSNLPGQSASGRQSEPAGSVRTLRPESGGGGCGVRMETSSGQVHGAFHAILQPLFLFRVLDVHVLDADRGAVGGAEAVENLAQRFVGLHVGRDRAAGSFDGAGKERAVEIPNREAVGGGIELGMIAGVDAERIDVRDKVAADAVSVDELNNRGFFGDVGIDRPWTLGRDLLIGLPRTGKYGILRSRKMRRRKPLRLAAVLHFGEEGAGFGALNDAVIVGAGDHQDLAQAEHGAHLSGLAAANSAG